MILPIESNTVPSNANPFYVTDSFTLKLEQSGIGPFIQYFQPGVANQSGVIESDRFVKVYIKSFHMVTLPVSFDQQQGINTDAFIGLYDITTTPATWQNRMPFTHPYGTADNGMVLNQVTKLSNNTPRAWREFGLDLPLILGQQTGSKRYQVGAGFQFNFGISPITVQYEYCLHGYWIQT